MHPNQHHTTYSTAEMTETETENGECSSLSSGSAVSRSRRGPSIGGVHDFDASTDWNVFGLTTLDAQTQRVIFGLRQQIQGMKAVQATSEGKLGRMRDAFLKRKKNGARELRMAMENDDVENVQKITNFVDTVLVKKEFILKDGWDVWSTSVNSFCQLCISRTGITVPQDQTAEQYWDDFMATKIHHLLGRKRDNVVQRIKNRWHSE